MPLAAEYVRMKLHSQFMMHKKFPFSRWCIYFSAIHENLDLVHDLKYEFKIVVEYYASYNNNGRFFAPVLLRPPSSHLQVCIGRCLNSRGRKGRGCIPSPPDFFLRMERGEGGAEGEGRGGLGPLSPFGERVPDPPTRVPLPSHPSPSVPLTLPPFPHPSPRCERPPLLPHGAPLPPPPERPVHGPLTRPFSGALIA